MKILLTGHKGFIGQNFMKLMPSTWQVETFDIIDNPSIRPKDFQLTDVDYIVHLGAISSTTEQDIQKIMDLNLSWSIELAEEAIKTRTNIQWASSASIYGNIKFPVLGDRYRDFKPLNHYAMSKYLFEKYMKSKESLFNEYHITWQGFRYFNVYGPHEEHKGNQSSPFTQFTNQAKETGVIKVFEGSDIFKRDFVPVDFVVLTHLKMMEIKKSGIFDIGTGNPISFLDVARDVASKYKANIETIKFPNHLKYHYQKYTCANTMHISDII